MTRHYEQVPAHSSLLPLPKPYVVPGGRFREVYYWDSYFTMLGLAESGQHQRVRDMLDNFAYLIDTYGHIPNGNRSYYLSRSQPPFFAYMVDLQARREGDAAYRRYLPQLQKEYAYWMEGSAGLRPNEARLHVVKLADGSLLNRYWDNRDTPRQESFLEDRATAARARSPAGEVYRDLRAGAESGWDFSSRWLDDGRELASIRTTAIVPVDLNALLYHLERTIAKACASSALKACEQGYGARAEKRRQAIEDHLWHPAGYYADYDWQRRRPIERINAASLFRYSPGWPPPNAPVVPPTASPPNCCARADWPPPPVPAASNGTSRTAGHPCSGSPYRACAPTAGTPWRKTSAGDSSPRCSRSTTAKENWWRNTTSAATRAAAAAASTRCRTASAGPTA